MKYTEENRAQLVEFLKNHELSAGLGTEESPCSVAAVNLAMTGRLTGKIPSCMSKVLGQAFVELQYAIPHDILNSARFKALLPDMAGTGRDREQERLGVLMDWMWATVLPELQPLADKEGFGAEWRSMCRERTAEAAYAAYRAARAAEWATYWAARCAAYRAAGAARCSAWWAAKFAEDWAAYRAEEAAQAAGRAAQAAGRAAGGDFWNKADPIGVLEQMTYLGNPPEREPK